MRALVLSSFYIFGDSPTLTLERAESVLHEATLINAFFNDIMNRSQEEDDQISVGRREALRQLFTLQY